MSIYDELEAKRKNCLRHTLIAVSALGAGFLMSFLGLMLLGIPMIAFGFIYLGVAVGRKNKAFKKFYKDHVVKAVLEEFLDEVVFSPETGIDKRIIENTEMMSMGNTYHSNDYIRASYKDTEFYQADVCIQNVTSNGKNTQVVTYFKGRWFVFKFNKSFVYDMQIKERSFAYAKVRNGWFKPKESRFKKIEFEDDVFNKTFVTRAVNEQEAFYIVTPHFMQDLMAFNDAVKGNILMCFVDNELHLALNNDEDAFEPSLFKKLDPETDRRMIINDISVITEFVDKLKLDRRLFK